MIENIRKYTGLMIVVLVLLFIGLVFLGDTATNVGVDKPIASVAGKKYGEKDFRKLAIDPLQIPSRIVDRKKGLSQAARYGSTPANHRFGWIPVLTNQCL